MRATDMFYTQGSRTGGSFLIVEHLVDYMVHFICLVTIPPSMMSDTGFHMALEFRSAKARYCYSSK